MTLNLSLVNFRHGTAIGAVLLLAACTAFPPVEESSPPVASTEASSLQVNETAMLPLLGYYHLLQRMTPAELTRERQTLASIPSKPAVQLRQAMLFGMPRTTTDLPRALALLESIQRSPAPEAVSLYPLARLLSMQYAERIKLDAQNDRLAQQLKESQRKRDELQEKIDALADIERSIPIRPNTVKPAP